jgi:hypothetical protein
MTSRQPSVLQIFRHISARLDRQEEQITRLHAMFHLQVKQIAALQAELNVLPDTRRRRRKIARARLQPLMAPTSQNRNGHSG